VSAFLDAQNAPFPRTGPFPVPASVPRVQPVPPRTVTGTIDRAGITHAYGHPNDRGPRAELAGAEIHTKYTGPNWPAPSYPVPN
jgi:hypothetical protein